MLYRVRAQKHSTFVRSNSTYFLILNISYSLYNFKRSQLWMIQLLVHWTIFRSFCTWIIIKYMHYFCCLKSADTSTTVMQPNEYYHRILVAGFGKSIVFATNIPVRFFITFESKYRGFIRLTWLAFYKSFARKFTQFPNQFPNQLTNLKILEPAMQKLCEPLALLAVCENWLQFNWKFVCDSKFIEYGRLQICKSTYLTL